MECLKCTTKNSDKAKYCYYCGNEFTPEERELAHKKGIGGFLRRLIKIKDIYSLSFITGKMWFRILSVLIILAIGIFNIYKNGSEFRIQNSEYYTYEYNKNVNEYYLYVNQEITPLSLYIPGNKENIKIDYYDSSDNLISSDSYTKEDGINVVANTLSNNYYMLNYGKKNIKLRVYNK